MMRKIKFYLIGLISGLLFVFLILNLKGTKCTGYLPNSRVREETLTKNFKYSEKFLQEMKTANISEQYLKDSIIAQGEIDFEKSHAQAKPCPDYLLNYPKNLPKFQITFTKCKEDATFFSVKKLR